MRTFKRCGPGELPRNGCCNPSTSRCKIPPATTPRSRAPRRSCPCRRLLIVLLIVIRLAPHFDSGRLRFHYFVPSESLPHPTSKRDRWISQDRHRYANEEHERPLIKKGVPRRRVGCCIGTQAAGHS